MKLKPKVIYHLAEYIFSHMSGEGRFEPKTDHGHVVKAIEAVIEKNLREEDDLEQLARTLLVSQLAKMPGAEIDAHKAFQMIKKQLAKEKGVVL